MDLAPTPTYEQSQTTEAQESALEQSPIEQAAKLGRGTLTVMEREDATTYAERGSLTAEPDADRQRAYEKTLETRDAIAVPPRVSERQDS